jgi:hypothetical protein
MTRQAASADTAGATLESFSAAGEQQLAAFKDGVATARPRLQPAGANLMWLPR